MLSTGRGFVMLQRENDALQSCIYFVSKMIPKPFNISLIWRDIHVVIVLFLIGRNNNFLLTISKSNKLSWYWPNLKCTISELLIPFSDEIKLFQKDFCPPVTFWCKYAPNGAQVAYLNIFFNILWLIFLRTKQLKWKLWKQFLLCRFYFRCGILKNTHLTESVLCVWACGEPEWLRQGLSEYWEAKGIP